MTEKKAKNGLQTPRDVLGQYMHLTIPDVSLATTVDNSISSATDIALNTATNILEVNAINGGVYLKYATEVSSSDFDEFIQEGGVRHFAIPSGVTLISVIERDSGAGVVVIEK